MTVDPFPYSDYLMNFIPQSLFDSNLTLKVIESLSLSVLAHLSLVSVFRQCSRGAVFARQPGAQKVPSDSSRSAHNTSAPCGDIFYSLQVTRYS